jgi:molybdenum cofactor synthesis domain-containing protein
VTAPEYQLLEKTELRVEHVDLRGADLTHLAAVVASALGIPGDDVLVIDVRDDRLALDIHRTTLDPYAIVGRQADLLTALDQLPGVTVTERTTIAAEGMLGWIADDPARGRRALDRAQRIAADVTRTIARRAIVFPTGAEVIAGQIRDTNTPFLADTLDAAGYTVTTALALPDDVDRIAAGLAEAGEERGFGLVVTTGGVGAEDKDATVEALLRLDPDAAAPYVCTFPPGGRHRKPGVRIAVGRVGTAVVVTLPGPHDEVRLGAAALVAGLRSGLDEQTLADGIARVLRDRLLGTMHRRHPE